MASITQPTLDKAAETSNTSITTTPGEKKKSTRTVRCLRIVLQPKAVRPTPVAAKRCFEITEICEMILEHAEPIVILRAMRINRKIKAIITGSKKLQARLFRVAIPAKANELWAFTGDPERQGRLLAGEKAAKAIQEAKPTDNPKLTTIQPYICNPLICHKYTGRHADPGAWHAVNDMQNVWSKNPNIVINRNLNILKIPLKSPSRALFVSQPPAKEVHVNIWGQLRFMDHEDRRGLRKWHWGLANTVTVQNADGVKFGEVADAVRLGLKSAWNGEFENMRFADGIPVTAEQKVVMERAGEATWRTDPTEKA
ncbi:hypothetical protein LTR22_017231 [Elasticomyces elasticus]|nr:hypothetical protein LTR22_017231 [Elasticomyces elasticus]KAK4925311.1 hypothetical protein LTR49_007609 [Elasticomyces elasticus]KAK5761318.1 hypothetical protein LTS12_008594 [Elasticomyces elasticus]